MGWVRLMRLAGGVSAEAVRVGQVSAIGGGSAYEAVRVGQVDTVGGHTVSAEARLATAQVVDTDTQAPPAGWTGRVQKWHDLCLTSQSSWRSRCQSPGAGRPGPCLTAAAAAVARAARGLTPPACRALVKKGGGVAERTDEGSNNSSSSRCPPHEWCRLRPQPAPRLPRPQLLAKPAVPRCVCARDR